MSAAGFIVNWQQQETKEPGVMTAGNGTPPASSDPPSNFYALR